MHPAIRKLKRLNRRWPGFFDLVRTRNGFTTPLTVLDQQRLHARMQADVRGMRRFNRAMDALVVARRHKPVVDQWLRQNGFITRRTLELEAALEEVVAVLESPASGVEHRAARRQLQLLHHEASGRRLWPPGHPHKPVGYGSGPH